MNYLTIDEAAKEIGVSNWTISRWLKEGKLSGRVFIASTAVKKVKQARDQKQRQQPPAPPSLLDYVAEVKAQHKMTDQQTFYEKIMPQIERLEAQLADLQRQASELPHL